MASCLPLLAQMPVFIIMFRVLHGLTYKPIGSAAPIARAVYAGAGQNPPRELGFVPRYISHTSELYTSLFGKLEMKSFGLDLAISPAQALADSIPKGLVYALLVVILAFLYFAQQRMVAARAVMSPTMSPQQQKLMQYLPVAFAIFQVFFLTGLIVYYMTQAILRIGQQAYITRKFYGHEESLGRQAQRAGNEAREIAKGEGNGNGDEPKKGLFAQIREQAAPPRPDDTSKPAKGGAPAKGSTGSAKSAKSAKEVAASKPSPENKRTTAPKGRPTPSGRPSSSGSRPSSSSRPGGARTKSGGKRRQ
jgi:YidC/Oxa1 family membrane protein insertase